MGILNNLSRLKSSITRQMQQLIALTVLRLLGCVTKLTLMPDIEGCWYSYEQLPSVAAYIVKESGIELSFRSDKKGGNFNVSAIAKSLSGGGHHNAAGASVKELPWINK